MALELAGAEAGDCAREAGVGLGYEEFRGGGGSFQVARDNGLGWLGYDGPDGVADG